MDLKNKITLQEAAQYAGVSYNTIRGAANRFLKVDSPSSSLLRCERSKIPVCGSMLIFTTEVDVDSWKRKRKRPGQYKRVKNNK